MYSHEMSSNREAEVLPLFCFDDRRKKPSTPDLGSFDTSSVDEGSCDDGARAVRGRLRS